MKDYSIAIMIHGSINSGRNALTEEKYSGLAAALREAKYQVDSVLYNDLLAERLETSLLQYDAILVWVNPVEQENDRSTLDALLRRLSEKGCFVSAHPEIILKMGTKAILHKTREMAFGGDVKIYRNHSEFKEMFLNTHQPAAIRILKQYRGNGGKGVFKIDTKNRNQNKIRMTHAYGEEGERILDVGDFFEEMKFYFRNKGMLIDQAWNPNIINGMVRCYITGIKVSGFGYQEINALYPSSTNRPKAPGRRYYFSEECGLFRDLRAIMETDWIPRLQDATAMPTEMMPVIWDADFFINTINSANTAEKYSLCEINASCVSPFPESAIPFMVEAVTRKMKGKN